MTNLNTMKQTIYKISGYILALGGFVAMFTEGDPRWQLLWTLASGMVCLLGCRLLAKAGVLKTDNDNAKSINQSNLTTMELTHVQKLRIGDLYEAAINLADAHRDPNANIKVCFEFDQRREFNVRIYDTQGSTFKTLYSDETGVFKKGEVNEECFNSIVNAAVYCEQVIKNEEERIAKSIANLEADLAILRGSQKALQNAKKEA